MTSMARSSLDRRDQRQYDRLLSRADTEPLWDDPSTCTAWHCMPRVMRSTQMQLVISANVASHDSERSPRLKRSPLLCLWPLQHFFSRQCVATVEPLTAVMGRLPQRHSQRSGRVLSLCEAHGLRCPRPPRAQTAIDSRHGLDVDPGSFVAPNDDTLSLDKLR